MPRFTVAVTMTHIRTYTFDAPDEEQAKDQAYDWADNSSGSLPDGCDQYDYRYHDEVAVE